MKLCFKKLIYDTKYIENSNIKVHCNLLEVINIVLCNFYFCNKRQIEILKIP